MAALRRVGDVRLLPQSVHVALYVAERDDGVPREAPLPGLRRARLRPVLAAPPGAAADRPAVAAARLRPVLLRGRRLVLSDWGCVFLRSVHITRLLAEEDGLGDIMLGGQQSKYRRPNSRGAFVGGPRAVGGSRECASVFHEYDDPAVVVIHKAKAVVEEEPVDAPEASEVASDQKNDENKDADKASDEKEAKDKE